MFVLDYARVFVCMWLFVYIINTHESVCVRLSDNLVYGIW